MEGSGPDLLADVVPWEEMVENKHPKSVSDRHAAMVEGWTGSMITFLASGRPG